jgi:hypothetical protein
MTRGASIVCAIVLMGATTAVRAQPTCTGDCDGNGEVTINELILGVNIALGNLPLSMCEAFDCEGNNMVPINCLIQGVNNALNGCNPSPTPTPTGTELVYTIDPGVPGMGPDASGTGIFVGIIGNTNAAVAFSPGPLTLVMGTPDSNGIASLTLKDDVTISVDIIDGSCLCLKLEAANEFGGSINCSTNAGPMYDTMATRAADAPDLRWTVTTGLGSPSGQGDANLLLTGLFDHVSSSCAAADCPTHTYVNPPNEFALTTTMATAVQEVASGPAITLTDPGSPFNCANFGMAGSGGKLAAPVPTVMDPVGPVAAVIRLAEMAPQ